MIDPDALARIHAASFDNARGWSEAEFADLLSSQFVFAEVAEHGFALGREIAGESELLTIAVLPEARGDGLGRDLLRRFEATSAARGAGLLFLEVAADNIPGLSLYRNSGWNESGQRVGYYARPDGSKQDAILMQKHLTLG
ncbi:GNAT family N-acetyltransferase [Aliiroseovarius sp. KMU-50]|uniref:GNAT family N-acetyltransferase n=1 Tax=Aliiroseovarius salicola TaxID=3009082 RepID=A0ABT4W400_9RHOB|nr:GNAT family N-acetyltransferase [Aliiroseovarius sp. KMU-50]MDA5095246.1 GNAT family N-acetyltransferase [Aliiroseovarius sp. KMU-50]